MPDFLCFIRCECALLGFTELPPGFQLRSSVCFQDISFRIPERRVDTIGTSSMRKVRCSDFPIENGVERKLITAVDDSR